MSDVGKEGVTEEQGSQAQELKEEDFVSKDPVLQKHHRPDGFLQDLVNLVNSSTDDASISLPITLQVGGFLVSGHLASGADYFTQAAKTVSGPALGATGEFSQQVYDWVSRYKVLYGPGTGNQDPTHVHLRDARIYDASGSRIPNSAQGTWWRGRISRVDAFFVGTLTDVKSPEN